MRKFSTIFIILLLFNTSCSSKISTGSQVNRDVLILDNYVDILSPDERYNSRTFSSIIKVDSEYQIYYSVRDRKTGEYSIYRNSSKDYKKFDNNDEIEIIPNNTSSYSFFHVYVPYVFFEEGKYNMIFTSREYENDFFESIHIATSLDSINWEVNLNPILIPEFEWEGNEIENWGVIKVGSKYYLNFESAGPNRLLEERNIGIAYSEDLINWEKLSPDPAIKNSVYCASFFSYNNEIYMIVPNLYKFKIYRFTSFEKLSEEDLIGYYEPYDSSLKVILDTPDVITSDIRKELYPEDELNFVFGTYRDGEWFTTLSKFKNVDEFLNQIKQ